MTDNKLVKGDICIYHKADGNGSANIVEVVEVINSDLSKIKCIQVIYDKSGNGWFEYMFQKGITMTASNEYLHKIDLINRQKAEIERYEKESNKMFDKWKLLDERTKQRYAELYEEAKGVVKAKAVKEFAERVKERAKAHYFDNFCYAVSIEEIDNLVKEMVGE